jgi:hypothetical protein
MCDHTNPAVIKFLAWKPDPLARVYHNIRFEFVRDQKPCTILIHAKYIQSGSPCGAHLEAHLFAFQKMLAGQAHRDLEARVRVRTTAVNNLSTKG